MLFTYMIALLQVVYLLSEITDNDSPLKHFNQYFDFKCALLYLGLFVIPVVNVVAFTVDIIWMHRARRSFNS